MKLLYHDSIWNQEHLTYEPKPMEFIKVFAPNVFGTNFLLFSAV
jgi:hypothetical protein